MNGIQEALRRIELQQQVLSRSALAFPIDAVRECKQLGEVSRDFAARASQPRAVKPTLDPKKVWQEWSSRKFDPSMLDARRLKALCSFPEAATQPELVEVLHRDGEALKRASCLIGLIASYFVRWGAIRNQDRMESLITKALRSYSRRNPAVLQYRDHLDVLFRPSAADRVAAMIIEHRWAPKECLKRFHIGLATNLATSTFIMAVRQFEPQPLTTGMAADPTDRLRYAIDNLFVPELPIAQFHASVSAIIASDWIEKYPTCRDMLRQYVLQHRSLGDPRLQVANWTGMSQAAKDRFLKWIAKESIVFFFNHVLPTHSADERRKNFWLEYAGRVTDFQVALSERDYNRLYASSRLQDVPGFGRVDHMTTSAFIMRFGEMIIVEFSETGNAAHAFAARAFETKAGTLRNRRFDFKKLKHEANDGRILHVGERWEYGARQKLAGWGVRP